MWMNYVILLGVERCQSAIRIHDSSLHLSLIHIFSIQVKQPWLLLQYGESDIKELGSDRVESLLSESPDTDDREDIVIEEIEDKDNDNLSVTKTMTRLGMVVFLFIFNIGISVFVFLLTGMMIFSQVLFIIYAMFLPVSFILSMIPTYEGMAKKAVMKLFNTIMMRAGISLIITTAFSISTMFYSISSGYPFFMVAFLQIVTFAGIHFKLGDLMALFSLQSSDTQQVNRRIMRRPYLFLNRGARRLEDVYKRQDYELPFEIDEYTPIEEVNRLCEMVEDLPEDIQDELSELLCCYSSLEELCEHADEIIHYPDCNDMTDVAYYFIDECLSLGEIPDLSLIHI